MCVHMLYLVFWVFEWWVLQCAQRLLVAALVLLTRGRGGARSVGRGCGAAMFAAGFVSPTVCGSGSPSAVPLLPSATCGDQQSVVAEGRSLATASLAFLFYHWDGATMCIPMVTAATSLPSGFGSAAALVG